MDSKIFWSPFCMRFFLIIFSLLLISKTSFGEFLWNENCKEAYSLSIQLKFHKAYLLLEKEKKENPNNTLVYFIENYSDYLRIQIGEEKSDFEKLKKNKKIRLNIIHSDKSTSPWYLYSQAEINLQWAANRLKFSEYITAALEINKAYKLLQKNNKLYPNFTPNKKSLGLLYCLIGSVPEQYNWILSFTGMEGNINSGLSLMNEAIQEMKTHKDFEIMLEEGYFLYSFLKMNLDNNMADLQKLLNELKDEDYLLLNFASSRIASKLGENDLAIQILENRKVGKDHYPFHYLDYLLGINKQNKMDNNCLDHFENYLINFKGINYKKSVLMRMSWHHHINGNSEKYEYYKNKINSIDGTQVDADKEAQFYFKNSNAPHINLLKARLLFDGGYSKLAVEELEKIIFPNFFNNSKNNLEYFYRYGRCMQQMGKDDIAINYYKKTVLAGSNESYYFAAKAALQIALLYEKSNNINEAKRYFNICIEMEDHQYELGIEQKAKAGLNRLN